MDFIVLRVPGLAFLVLFWCDNIIDKGRGGGTALSFKIKAGFFSTTTLN